MVEFSDSEPTGVQSEDLGDAAAYLNRGRDHLSKEEYALAIADFSQAIALDPDFAFAYYSRAAPISTLRRLIWRLPISTKPLPWTRRTLLRTTTGALPMRLKGSMT